MFEKLSGIKIAFALTGSFCTFERAITQMEKLAGFGAQIIPIMSVNAYSTDTRFGSSVEFRDRITSICGREIIHSIEDAEPIGPNKMADVMLVAPCTGNTAAKLAGSITDTPVTMAVKSHIRNARPVVLCLATNDALSGSAKNMGVLLNSKHYYFVPMRQDDCNAKPTSLVAEFELIPETVAKASEGKQIQPMFLCL